MLVDLKDFCEISPSQLEVENTFYGSTLKTSRKYRLALIRLPKTLKTNSLSSLIPEDSIDTDGHVGTFDSNGLKYMVKKSVLGDEISLVMPKHDSKKDNNFEYSVLEPISEVWHVEEDVSIPCATKEQLDSFKATRPAEGVRQPQLIRKLLEKEESIRPVIIQDKNERKQEPTRKKHKKQ